MIKIYVSLISIFLILQLTSCKDVPPVIPGLTKSKVALYTYPDSATIYFNKNLAGNVTPLVISDLEPGFFRFDIHRNTYLDTTIYYLLKRNVEDSLYCELREDPKYWWKTYTAQNSTLPFNNLTKVRIDKYDNKWVGSAGNGLIKFDGNVFTVYNISNSGIPGNRVNDIFISDNIIWVGTDHGIGRFDGSVWKAYNLSNSQIPDEYITSLTIDHYNNLWAGTQTGILKFDGVAFTIYNKLNSGLSSDNISALAVDSYNALWVGTLGAGLCKFDNFTWSVFSSFNSQLPDNYVTSIKLDNTGMIWVGTGIGGSGDNGTGSISYYKNSNWYNLNRLNSGFQGNLTTDFTFDINNNLWITTDKGLLKYDGKKWRFYTTSNSGLPWNSVKSVAIDSNQDKWCTSVGLAEYIGGKL